LPAQLVFQLVLGILALFLESFDCGLSVRAFPESPAWGLLTLPETQLPLELFDVQFGSFKLPFFDFCPTGAVPGFALGPLVDGVAGLLPLPTLD
jgi:hypothetical protein